MEVIMLFWSVQWLKYSIFSFDVNTDRVSTNAIDGSSFPASNTQLQDFKTGNFSQTN